MWRLGTFKQISCWCQKRPQLREQSPYLPLTWMEMLWHWSMIRSRCVSLTCSWFASLWISCKHLLSSSLCSVSFQTNIQKKQLINTWWDNKQEKEQHPLFPVPVGPWFILRLGASIYLKHWYIPACRVHLTIGSVQLRFEEYTQQFEQMDISSRGCVWQWWCLSKPE